MDLNPTSLQNTRQSQLKDPARNMPVLLCIRFCFLSATCIYFGGGKERIETRGFLQLSKPTIALFIHPKSFWSLAFGSVVWAC